MLVHQLKQAAPELPITNYLGQPLRLRRGDRGSRAVAGRRDPARVLGAARGAARTRPAPSGRRRAQRARHLVGQLRRDARAAAAGAVPDASRHARRVPGARSDRARSDRSPPARTPRLHLSRASRASGAALDSPLEAAGPSASTIWRMEMVTSWIEDSTSRNALRASARAERLDQEARAAPAFRGGGSPGKAFSVTWQGKRPANSGRAAWRIRGRARRGSWRAGASRRGCRAGGECSACLG